MRRNYTAVSWLFAVLFLYGCGTEPVEIGKSIPDRIPYTLTDDFEDGAINGWESYPYIQDIGCDPGIVCQNTPAFGGSKYALAKIVTPNDNVELDIGMTKQCKLWTTTSSRIRFAYFLGTDRVPDTLEIILGTDEGKQYIHTIKNPSANEWIEADVPLMLFYEKEKAFEAHGNTGTGQPDHLNPGELIRAVVIQARYSLVSSFKSYTTVIDDFRLPGERQRQFIAVNPRSTYLDKYYFSFLNRHYYYGDSLDLGIEPERHLFHDRLEKVSCTLYDSRNEIRAEEVLLYDDGTHGDEKAGDGIRTNSAVYRFSGSDPRGIWNIHCTGIGAAGRFIEWNFSFMVPGRRLTASDHPRLLFTSEELSGIINNPKDSVQTLNLNNLLENSRATLRNLRNEDIVERGDVPGEFWGSGEDIAGKFSISNDAYDRWANPLRRRALPIIRAGSILYAFAGDEEAGIRAKDALIRISRFRQWNHPVMEQHARYMYYPVGYVTQGAALGYDLLYPLLSDDEKALVRRALIEKSIEPTYRDGTYYNRFSSNLSNHYGVSHTGALMAVAAIYGEYEENPMLEPYLSGMLAKFKAHLDAGYLSDGSYQEPVGYHNMDSESRAVALDVIERNFGVDYSTTTNFCRSYLYPAYVTFRKDTDSWNDPRGLDSAVFGDAGSGHYAGEMDLCLWAAYRTRDPLAYSIVRPRLASGKGELTDVIWYVNDIENPVPVEELPSSRIFPEKGNAVLRSGWKKGDTLLTFRCGTHSNHYHFDQGTFWLVHNGEALLSEAGVTDYYGNLYYQSYYIQPIAHNTMLIDSHPESQMQADFNNGVRAHDNYPRFTDYFTGEIQDAVEGELSCVYRGKLDTYTRSFVFVKPYYLILYDKVKSKEPHTFNWLFHTDGKKSIRVEENTVSITRPQADLRMDILRPDNFRHRIKHSPDQDKSFIMIDTPSTATEARLLVVLTPSAKGKTVVKDVISIKTEGWVGARVHRGTGTDLTLFRSEGNDTAEPVEDFATDADRFTVRVNSYNTVEGFWLQNGRYLTGENMEKTGRQLFDASDNLTAAVSYLDRGADMETKADSEVEIRLALSKRPRKVFMNAEKVIGFEYSDSILILIVPSGFTRFEIR